MTVCLNCGAENPDGAVQCRICKKPVSGAMPAGEADPSAAKAEPASDPEGEDDAEAPANAEAEAAAPPPPAPPPPPPSPAPPARQGFDMPPEESAVERDEPEPADDEEVGEDAEEDNEFGARLVRTLEQRLSDIEDSEHLTIGVIGFHTSGKTFFIARLKQYLMREGTHLADPPQPLEGEEVQGTRDIEAHDFLVTKKAQRRMRRGAKGADRFENFHVIDIPGEQFDAAVKAYLQGPNADRLLRVLRLSHALIIVLPARDVFAPYSTEQERVEYQRLKQAKESAKAELERCRPALDSATGEERKTLRRKCRALEKTFAALDAQCEVLSHVEADERSEFLLNSISMISGHARELEQDGSKRKELAEKLQSGGPVDDPAAIWSAPAYVALAKADLLLGETAASLPHLRNPGKLDVDPASAFRLHRPELYRLITESFPWHKFDFMTCFKNQPKKDLRIAYRRAHHGVTEVDKWIGWVRDFSRETGRRRRNGLLRWWPEARQGLSALLVALALWIVGIRWEVAALAAGAVFLVIWLLRDRLSLVRMLGRLREEGAVIEPANLGLRLPRARGDDAHWLSPELRQRLALWVDRVMLERPPRARGRGWRTRRLAAYGGVGLLWGALATWLLFGFFRELEATPGGYALDLRPVYAAEIRRMEEDASVFARGAEEKAVSRWLAIPDNGGWFHIPPRTGVRDRLERAMRLLPERAAPGSLDPEVARSVRDILGEAASASSDELRGANNYHQGLVALLSGQAGSAAQAFSGAEAEIGRRLAAAAPGRSADANRRYTETTSRLYAAQISALHALGVAEMERGRWDAAGDAFERAADIARAQRTNRIVDGTTMDRFWFTVTTYEPAMLRLSLADVWTNMLAARIRQHAAAVRAAGRGGDAAEEAERIRAVLEARVEEAAGHAAEASEHPQLAANLVIAAARAGAEEPDASGGGTVVVLSRFFINEAPSREVQEVKSYSPVLMRPEHAQHPSGRYWNAVRQWRSALQAQRTAGAGAAALIDQRIAAAEAGPERDQLEQWLCEAIETEYEAASGTVQREITRNYGRFCGQNWMRVAEARAPFGFKWGAVLLILLTCGALALRRAFRRTKEMYRRLFVPRHRTERLPQKA